MPATRIVIVDPPLENQPYGHNFAFFEEVRRGAREIGIDARFFGARSDGQGADAGLTPLFRVNAYWRPNPNYDLPTDEHFRRAHRVVLEDMRGIDFESCDAVWMPTASPIHLRALASALPQRPSLPVAIGLLQPLHHFRRDPAHDESLSRLIQASLAEIAVKCRPFQYGEDDVYRLAQGDLRRPVLLQPLAPSSIERRAALGMAAPLPDASRPVAFGFLGAPRSDKGARLLLEAAALVPPAERARIRIRFLLPAEYEEFARAARAAGPHVEAIARRRLADQYVEDMAALDVILLPYRPAEYAGRSSGIVADAASLGRPTLVTRGLDVVEAFLNRLAPASFRTAPFDAEALARAMLAPAEEWRRLARAARQSAGIVLRMRDLRRMLAVAGLLPDAPEPSTP